MENHGWARIIRDLRDGLASRLDTDLSVASESLLGLPVFRADTSNLTDEQVELALRMTDRAEAVARETCSVCGKFGVMSYQVGPPQSGIRCDKHRGDWNVL